MKSKTDYRIYAKELRKSLDIHSLSKKAVNAVKCHPFYRQAKNIMLFYPLKYEIDLRYVLKDNKNFYLPKVDGENLLVCPYTDNLEKSCYNIMEPCSNPVSPDIIDLVIVPALMVDKKGYRLGYGGGFYDRFLNKFKVKTITCIPEIFVVDSLPYDDFDVKIDEIIIV